MKQIRNKNRKYTGSKPEVNRKKTGKMRKPKRRVPSWEHAIFFHFQRRRFRK